MKYNFNYIPKEEQDLNDKLINLYGEHLLNLYVELKNIYDDDNKTTKPALPLLLWLKDDGKEYASADLKIVAFGVETNNWNNPSTGFLQPNFDLKNSDDVRAEIDRLQDLYNGYYNECDGKRTKFLKNGPDLLLEVFKKHFKGRKISVVWNNINKIGNGNKTNGNATGRPKSYIYEAENKTFDVVAKELEILKPDIVVLMTGKVDEKYISNRFPEVAFYGGEKLQQNAEMNFSIGKGNLKPYVLYRSNPHPSARKDPRKKGFTKEMFSELYSLIANDIEELNIC